MTGSELRALRKARHLTQTGLAEAIGMPGGQTYISSLEAYGDKEISVKADTLQRIASALGKRVQITLVDPAPLEEVTIPAA